MADCELCELHPGEADGLTWEEMVEQLRGPGLGPRPARSRSPRAGESWLGFYERCESALARIVERHAGERVVLVVHGGVIEQAMKMCWSAVSPRRG